MASVLIFDDDPGVGSLVADLVRGWGLTVEHHLSAGGIVEIVRAARPRIVVLDIMMPGLDGLSACRAIRADPSTRHVKTVMLTSKASELDQETAKRYGADSYVTKPFSVPALSGTLSALLGMDLAAEVPKTPAPPVAVTVMAGGAVLECGDLWVVLDAGAGVGRWIESRRTPPREVWLLLSRYEPAALAELDAVGLLLAVGTRLRLAGPDTPESPLQRLAPRLSRAAGVTRVLPLLHPLREGELALAPGATATALYAQHPGTTMAYRLDFSGRRVVFCPAHAPGDGAAARESHDFKKFRDFFSGVDLLVHGFARSADQAGTGASWESVVDLAAAAGVRSLLLTPLPGAALPGGLAESVRARAAARGLDAAPAEGEPRLVL